MFNKIDIELYKSYMTKYPNGKTIFEAMTETFTSYNKSVEEVNAKVAEGLLAIDAAYTTLYGELTALFSNLETEFNQSFDALQDQITGDNLAFQNSILAQLAEKVKSVNGVLPDVNGNVAITAGGIPAEEGWITPTLLNGWTEHTTVRYKKDALGWVHLKGAVGIAVYAQSTIFTLPVGYRPIGSDLRFPVATNAGFGRTNISSNGAVSSSVGSTTFNSFDGILFKAEA